jgi:DsbC/DsbD-like thiol-disulfide interchange protein
MKKFLSLCVGILAFCLCMAQNPVTWNYSTKKISKNVYEIHLKASIEKGWHLYSQKQGEDFLGIPTKVKFARHPLVKVSGKPAEVGDLEKSKDPVLNIESAYYSSEVDFVQTITIQNNIKTTINGNIEFQVCTNEKCLPPASVSFSVSIN